MWKAFKYRLDIMKALYEGSYLYSGSFTVYRIIDLYILGESKLTLLAETKRTPPPKNETKKRDNKY